MEKNTMYSDKGEKTEVVFHGSKQKGNIIGLDGNEIRLHFLTSFHLRSVILMDVL